MCWMRNLVAINARSLCHEAVCLQEVSVSEASTSHALQLNRGCLTSSSSHQHLDALEWIPRCSILFRWDLRPGNEKEKDNFFVANISFPAAVVDLSNVASSISILSSVFFVDYEEPELFKEWPKFESWREFAVFSSERLWYSFPWQAL